MLVRHVADYRTLFWAFILFPLVPAIAYARPSAAPFLLPASLYLAFCSGAFIHNHNHSALFKNRNLNAAYAIWLSVFYGFPAFSWIPTHNQNHHRYLNGPGDATRTTRWARADSLYKALTYPLLSSYWQAPALARFTANARTRRPALFRQIVAQSAAVVIAHVAACALCIALHGASVGVTTYALVLGVPALFAPWSLMFTNYVQHVGCDPASPDNHSRNFVSPFWNWFVFDAGYHTVHHEHPGAHWSECRKLHERRAARIDPALNESSILGFAFKQYVLGALLSRYRTAETAARVADGAHRA